MGHEEETPGHETLLLVSILSGTRAVKQLRQLWLIFLKRNVVGTQRLSFALIKQDPWQYESDISFAMEGKEIMFYVMIMKLHLSSRLVSNLSLYLEYRW